MTCLSTDADAQLAANGPSVVTKIRVVAVTLLDALPAADYGDANVQGIAAYLLGEHFILLVPHGI